MAVDKVVLTNVSALRDKYKTRYPRVAQALARLIAADRERGLATRLVAIDSAADMAACGATPVTDGQDQRQVKEAVDAIHEKWTPAYLSILGAPDVVPHQELSNPVYEHGVDDDRVIPSDVPYACEAGYSRRPQDFLGPTRVVGRVPDAVGDTDPAYLVRLLGTAVRWRKRKRDDYRRYFAVSAYAWKGSSALSVEKLFGSSDDLALSPPEGPRWSPARLAARVHFINCHGSPNEPHFYGQVRNSYPIAHSASRLVKKVSNGAVIAAECCYGAQLYDRVKSGYQAGICSTYLADGAYGFFGSSTIAYGPSEGNGQADFICQYFVEAVLDGASLGRACLQARHRFAQAYTHLDPTDLKTLVQFNLLGDPSIEPVGAVPHALSRSQVFRRAFRARQNDKGLRALRRERLLRTGANLQSTLGAVREKKGRVPAAVQRVLLQAARESGIGRHVIKGFTVRYAGSAPGRAARRSAARRKGRRVYLLSGVRRGRQGPPKRVVNLVATVQDGVLIHLRRVHSR